MLKILGRSYLKLLRSLLTMLIGPVVKYVCDQRLQIIFPCSSNSFIMWIEILLLVWYSFIPNNWMFLWWMLIDWSLCNKSSNEETLSL